MECLWNVFDQYLLTEAMVFEKSLRRFFLKNKGINYKINKSNIPVKFYKTGCKNKMYRKGFNKKKLITEEVMDRKKILI